MGFFDETWEKAKDVFEVAAKKTEEVAAVGKQKYDIASLKSKLAKNYECLGMICFKNMNIDDITDEDTRHIVLKIRENLTDIDKANEELLKIKNQRACPKCAAAVDEKAAYCAVCGAKMD